MLNHKTLPVEHTVTGYVPVATEYPPRLEMVRKLTDLVVLPTGCLTRNERSFVADILLTLLGELNEEKRLEIACRLAKFAEVPLPLIRALLKDKATVARPILKATWPLPSNVLLEAAAVGEEHRLLIARRQNVSDIVVDALVEAGEVAVIEKLLCNMSLHISERTLGMIVLRSQGEPQLQDLLLHRPELDIAHGFAMFWWANSARRQKILNRFTLNRGVIQDALQPLFPVVMQDPYADLLTKRVLKLVDRRLTQRGGNNRAIDRETIEQTLRLVPIQPSQGLAEAIGLIAGISTTTAARVIYDSSGETFAILCKGLGVTRQTFADILNVDAVTVDIHPDCQLYQDPQKRAELQATFDSIARDYALTILRYWEWRANTILSKTMSLQAV